MNPLVIALGVLCCTFGGALSGMWLRKVLPRHHLDVESKEAATRATSLVVTMSALVLGLVIAAAKSDFDREETTVQQSAASLLTLDRALARYGPEAAGIREELKQGVALRLQRLWSDDWASYAGRDGNPDAIFALEQVMDRIRALTPPSEAQRWLQSRALQLGSDLLEARWLDADREGTTIPHAFLVIIVCWITLLLAAMGLHAPRHGTMVGVFAVCALSVSSAIFLILELSRPFDGVISVSSAPLQYALSHLGK